MEDSTRNLKIVIDDIRNQITPRMSMAKGRDKVALVVCGKPYAQMMAAAGAGHTIELKIDEERLAVLVLRYGSVILQIAKIAKDKI